MTVFHVSADLIEEVGLEAAVFLDGVSKLFHHKATHGLRARDGRVWVWTSDARVAEEYFPFWSRKTVLRIRNALVAQGVLVEGSKAACATEHDSAAPTNATWWAFADEDHWFRTLNIASGKRPPKVRSGTFKSPIRDIQKSGTGHLPQPLDTPDQPPINPGDPPRAADAAPAGTDHVLFDEYGSGTGRDRKPAQEEEAPKRPATLVDDPPPSVPPSALANAPQRAGKTPGVTPGTLVWRSYAEAYERRYGVAPSSNKTTARYAKELAESMPLDEAIGVAAFYLTSQNQFYVGKSHDIRWAAQDANSLRTQMLTGRRVTATSARQSDLASANLEAARRVTAKLRSGQEDW